MHDIKWTVPLALGHQLRAVWWEMYGGCRVRPIGQPKTSKVSRLRG